MTFAVELTETFAATLALSLILTLLLRRSGKKVNWGFCFAYPFFITLGKAIGVGSSTSSLTMFLILAVPLTLFILIAIMRRRRTG